MASSAISYGMWRDERRGGYCVYCCGKIREEREELKGLGHMRSAYSRARLAQTNSRSFLAKTCLYA